MFIIVTIISVLGLLFGITFNRFRKSTDVRKEFSGATLFGYFAWLFSQTSTQIKTFDIKRLWTLLENNVMKLHTTGERRIFMCLGLSFLFLATSGFLSALLSSRRLYGLPLLVHVSVGGLFAISLFLALFLRAREYRLDTENSDPKDASTNQRRIPESRPFKEKILFWSYFIGGFFLILTALMMLLPLFSFDAQLDIFEVHRYSALVALLSGMAFIDTALRNEGK